MTDRDSAVRGMLVEQVESTRLVALPSRRRLLIGGALAFILSGAIAGGAVSAIASGVPEGAIPAEQTSYVVDFPSTEGLGREIEYFGDSIAYLGTGTDVITASPRPSNATSLFVIVQCLTPGEISPAPRGRPDDPTYSSVCGEEQFDPTDLPEAGGFFFDDIMPVENFVDVTATEGTEWRVTLSWVGQRPWATNDRGETYGLTWGLETYPDLIFSRGANAAGESVDGYLKREDYEAASDFWGKNPENFADVTLYASDGVTPVGSKRIGGY